MKIEDIMEMWDKDSEINQFDLSDTTVKTSRLHSKYLQLYTKSKLMLKKYEMEMRQLEKDKFLWYNGKMSKQDMDERGWKYDPQDGVRVVKSDLHYFYKSDSDVLALQARIDYTKMKVEILQEILENIKWRHTHIKNIIEWRKFESGA